MLDYLCTQTSTFGHGCILRRYADIPNNDFGLPTLDYLHTQASTLIHGCILHTYADFPETILAFQCSIICANDQVPMTWTFSGLRNLSVHKNQQWDAEYFNVYLGNYTNRYWELLRMYAKISTPLLRFGESVSAQNTAMERRLQL